MIAAGYSAIFPSENTISRADAAYAAFDKNAKAKGSILKRGRKDLPRINKNTLG